MSSKHQAEPGDAAKSIPPRIHVVLAREAPVGIVFRRGPSKAVCTFLWNRKTDEFTLGQWLKGRIYERRSDLSPDGRHLIYFAMNGQWTSPSKGSWTAVSRAPFLKAVAFYPKGDCWFGGGLFLNDHCYWLNGGIDSNPEEPSASAHLRRDPLFQPQTSFGGECPGVYYHRLLRDGWMLVQRQDKKRGWAFDIFEKNLRLGWKLRKIAHVSVNRLPGKGCYWDEHELVHTESGQRIPFTEWEWADEDAGRLVWARGGRIFSGDLQPSGLMGAAELRDFADDQLEAVEAPY